MNKTGKPIIISIVSGKGGCGKTRIATALARFLSEKSNVLLIDMDLHNQGLTTLLNPEIANNNYTIYDALNLEFNNFDSCELTKTKNSKVFFLPSINQHAKLQTNLMEIEKNYTPERISDKLNKLIYSLTEKFPIDCIIFDNTGLPDALSIGSSLCSDKILIVTQPDNVSWNGALNFYRIFMDSKGNANAINFVVNNVPKKYTYPAISDLFGGFDFKFITFIPFEYGIMESFGRNPFDDDFLIYTQFYQKIGYIGATILNQIGRSDLLSEQMIKYSTESIKEDLKEKYTTSLTREEMRAKFFKNFTMSALLVGLGMTIWFYATGTFKFQFEDIYKFLGISLIVLGFYYYLITLNKYTRMTRKNPPS